MVKVLEGFERYLLEERKARRNTVDSYMRDVSAFTSRLRLSGDAMPFVGEADVQKHLDYMLEEGLSVSSVRRAKASLSCFFKYLDRSKDADNPAMQAKIGGGDKKMPPILSREEVERLLSAPDPSTGKGLRDRCMIDLVYATGLKVSELISLNVPDVQVLAGYVRCNGAKGCRFVPIHDQAARRLEDYVKTLGVKDAADRDCPLFPNNRGGRLSRQGFWKILREYALKSQIDKPITPQVLRYSLAFHLLENGADRQVVQDILGYADVSSLHMYIQMLKGSTLSGYNKFHPKAAGK